MPAIAPKKQSDLEQPAITPKNIITVGDYVRLISGELTDLEGVVVRCERDDAYVIGIPNAQSHIMVRVHRQRLRRASA
jgi:hypothetical protein